MSVVRVTRVNLTGERTNTDHTYTHSYEVQVSSRDDQQQAVLTAPGIPQRGMRHPEDPSAVVTSLRARLTQERRWPLWAVDVNYAIVQGNEDAVTGERDPTQPPDYRPPELRIRTATYDRALSIDLDGAFLRNTAGEMFSESQRTIREFYPVVNYRRWWRAVDFDPLGAVQEYVGKVNEVAWYNAEPRTAQIHDISSEREIWSGQIFFRVDYEIAIRADGWQMQLPNEGLHTLGIPALGEATLRPIVLYERDDDGNKTGIRFRAGAPYPLEMNGWTIRPDGAPPYLLDFRVYDDLDFGTIGL